MTMVVNFCFLQTVVTVGLLLGGTSSALILKPSLRLTELSYGHTVVGENIIFRCDSSFYSNYTSIEWIMPKGVDSSSAELEHSELVGNDTHYVVTKKLTIYGATKGHSGYYRCRAVHKQWPDVVYSNEIWVPVYDPTEHVIEFSKTNVFNQAEAEIQVRLRAHPNISVTWMHKDNTIITNLSSDHIRIHNNPSPDDPYFNYYTTLQFKRMSLEDFGVYAVIAENNFEKKWQNFSVSLRNTVAVTTSAKIVDKGLEKCMYTCKIVGYPKPKMAQGFASFTFDEIDLVLSNSSMFVYKEVTPAEDNGLILLDYRLFQLSSEPTMFACKNYRIAGQKSTVSHSLMFDPEDEFDIVGEDIIDVDGRKILEVTYEDPVTITAVVSLYSYNKQINVYRNGKRLTNSNPFYTLICTDYTDKAICYVIFKYYILESQTGKYKFEALTSRGEIHTKTIEMVPRPIINFTPQLTLRSMKDGHYIEGENISLECTGANHQHAYLEWYKNTVRIKPTEDIKIVETSSSNYTFVITSQLTIFHARPNDSDTYRCLFYETENTTDNFLGDQPIRIFVFKVNETAIEYESVLFLWEKAQIQIKLIAFPKPSLIQWFGPNNSTPLPETTSRFSITNQRLQNKNEYLCTLTFKHFNYQDFGNYTMTVEIGNLTKAQRTLEVGAHGTPSTKIAVLESSQENSTMECTAISYPEPTIKWYFDQCKDLISCLNMKRDFGDKGVEKKELSSDRRGLLLSSYLSLNSSVSGALTCRSNAIIEHSSSELIINPVNGFEVVAKNIIFDDQEGQMIIEAIYGEQLTLWCIGSVYSYTKQMYWYFKEVESYEYLEGTQENLLLSTVSVITVPVTASTSSYYICNAVTINGTLKSHTIHIKKRETAELYVHQTNMANGLTQVPLGTKLTFFCYAVGFPRFIVRWVKNGEELQPSEKINILNGSQVLFFKNIETGDEGSYSCQISNGFKELSRSTTLVIGTDLSWLYALIALVVTAFVALVSYNIVKIRKERKLLRELKVSDLAYFEKGAVENLNPRLGIEDQAHLLPYNRKWEIPKDKIKLGKQLGCGAFGVVYSAEIVDFFPNEPSKTVAVKTVDRHSGYECVKILAAELKIMAHLGAHVNVVNLLGACTKNIIKRELFVIVEYCPFGNLHDHMLEYGKGFFDQKNYETDEYDWTTTSKDLDVAHCSPKGEVNYSYEPDSGEENPSICSQDLVVWAFQITKGMEYLAARRIVHGDLAARNVLLARENVIKISDFGLSKKMYKYGNYVKSGKGPLPVKWMAMESIRKGVFSTQSDVWAFGVVLWELFSLGDTPYPGVPFDETYKLLLTGYRMEAPEAATHFIYETMLDCWNLDPALRPTFTELAGKIGSLLRKQVRNHYLDMNGGYIELNNTNLADCDDCLMVMNSPSYENIVSLN